MTTPVFVHTIPRVDSFVGLSELGKRPAPYAPTYRFPGEFINKNHQYYSKCPRGYKGISVCIDLGIDGYLQQADALKLYELAFFSQGDILELGTYCGLSTTIISQAIRDAELSISLDTVDIDKDSNSLARKNVLAREGGERVNFHLIDATEYMDRAIAFSKQYSFIFIDHWHGYEATYAAAMRAKKLLSSNGFCLFHDYNDPANADLDHVYGVYQAAHDAMLCDPNFDFYGTFGCTALFKKRSQSSIHHQ